MTENSDNYIRTHRKTETANTLEAGKTITLAAGENLSARNTTVLSENGQITVAAKGDVNLENGYNESRDDYGLKYKELCITVIIILLWAGFTSDYVERVKLEWEKNAHDQNISVTNNGGK